MLFGDTHVETPFIVLYVRHIQKALVTTRCHFYVGFS